MPSGRKPDGDAPLSNAERQALYRLHRRAGQPAAAARTHRASDRRSRPQRWRAAVAELLTLQAVYAPGSKHCLQRFGALRRPMPCKPPLILILRCSQRSSRRVATAVTDETSGLAGRTAFSFCWVKVTASRAALRAPASAGCGP
jgi:hypothetical protein